MANVEFVKINGAGNDFILLDAIKNSIPNLPNHLIKEMCDRRKGIGADGLLLIENSEKQDFKLTYFNSDGNVGSLCGNGSRCAIYYALNNFLRGESSTEFICENKIYTGYLLENNSVKFNLGNPTDLMLNQKINFEKNEIIGHFINTGSPHVVIFWETINHLFNKSFFEFDFPAFGKKIRNSKIFSPNGTNVNLIFEKDGQLYIRSYERGVEDETLACGTGTTASALVSNLIIKKNPPISFITRDNDELIINFEKINNNFSKISLTGPVKINYIGAYDFQ